MVKMNPVVHFEMPAEDKKRMADFYMQTFGWEINQMGKEFGDYMVVMTTESDKNGPFEKGRINGGFYQRSKPDQVPSLVISVDDIQEAMKKVTEAGGKILGGAHKAGEPDDIPGVGLFCGFIDTEGNQMGMLQPKGM